MAKPRKIRCPHCGFLDTIKRVKERDIHAIIVKIVRAISQIAASILLIRICLYGLSIGCEISKVYPRLRKKVDIAKEL